MQRIALYHGMQLNIMCVNVVVPAPALYMCFTVCVPFCCVPRLSTLLHAVPASGQYWQCGAICSIPDVVQCATNTMIVGTNIGIQYNIYAWVVLCKVG